jgi:hypothetical protein
MCGLFVGFLDEGNSKEFPAQEIAYNIKTISCDPKLKPLSYVHTINGVV